MGELSVCAHARWMRAYHAAYFCCQTMSSIYVGNLAYSTSEDGLRNHFSSAGAIKDAQVVRMISGRSKGFGYVNFESGNAADVAIAQLNNAELDGRQLRVELAKSYNPERPALQTSDAPAAAGEGSSRPPRGRGGRGRGRGRGRGGRAAGDAAGAPAAAPAAAAAPVDGEGGERRGRGRGRGRGRAPRAPRVAAENRKETSNRVFVANLPYAATDEDLKAIMPNFNVSSVRIAKRPNGRSLGFAFVDFASHDEQQKAVNELQNKEVLGRAVRLTVAWEDSTAEATQA
jgi:RNA recognition motif-containing protein